MHFCRSAVGMLLRPAASSPISTPAHNPSTQPAFSRASSATSKALAAFTAKSPQSPLLRALRFTSSMRQASRQWLPFMPRVSGHRSVPYSTSYFRLPSVNSTTSTRLPVRVIARGSSRTVTIILTLVCVGILIAVFAPIITGLIAFETAMSSFGPTTRTTGAPRWVGLVGFIIIGALPLTVYLLRRAFSRRHK